MSLYATSRSSHPISSLKALVHLQGYVSLDGVSVNHPIKVLEPDQHAGISRMFCEADGQDAAILRFFMSLEGPTRKTPTR